MSWPREITEEGHEAARTVSQWHLGDPSWASMLIGIATTEDPRASAEDEIGDDEFDEIWTQAQRRDTR